MVNISKTALDKKLKERLFRQFAKFVGSLSNTNSGSVLAGLFSEKEHMMFAKRLAIVFMLEEGCSRRTIARTLSVSRTTVLAIEKQCDEGRYGALVRTGRRRSEEREEMWETINAVLRLGMPSMGKDRWKWMDSRPRRRARGNS